MTSQRVNEVFKLIETVEPGTTIIMMKMVWCSDSVGTWTQEGVRWWPLDMAEYLVHWEDIYPWRVY